MPLKLTINGQPRIFDGLTPGSTINALLEELGVKADRIALEINGRIAPRTSWGAEELAVDDMIEVVHFVGGGSYLTCNTFSNLN